MAKKIDPAFRTGTFLGESSQDPISFVRRNKTLKEEAAKRKRDEIDQSTQKGLEKLMLDLKGWEDQEGFKEIMDRQNKTLDLFTQLSKKGLNLTSPKSSQEIEAYRAINQYHTETKQIVDEWNRQKGVYDQALGLIRQEATKPSTERRVDEAKTMERIKQAMQGASISDRKMSLDNLLALKVNLGDILKKVNEAENAGFFKKPTVTQSEVIGADGIKRTTSTETLSPEDEAENVRKAGILFEGLDKEYKDYIKTIRDKDPDPVLNIMPEKDYFATIAVPAYREKFIKKQSKTSGSGGGLSLNFLGQKTTLEPGVQRDVPLPYGDRTYTNVYEFAGTKPVKVNYGAKGSSVFMGNTWTPLTGGGDVEAELRFYDPTRDEFVFRTTKAGIAPFMMNEMTFAVPRSVIGDQADELPIMKDGKKTTLKDLYGSKPPVKKASSVPSNFWSKPVYLPGKNK